MSSLNFPIYILGDLNCNLLNGDSRDARALVDFYRSYNLSQLIDAPTRITESSKSLLDVILASHANQVQKAEVIQSSISDHDLVYVLLCLKKLRPKPTFVTTRSYKHYNADAFLHDISQVPWSVIEAFSDVDDKLNAFNLLFNDIFDQHAPLKTFRVHGKPNPCVTDNIRALTRERDSWRRLAKRTNDPMAWSAYKNFRREVKREIRFAASENLSPIRSKVILETPITFGKLFAIAFRKILLLREHSAETIKLSPMSLIIFLCPLVKTL